MRQNVLRFGAPVSDQTWPDKFVKSFYDNFLACAPVVSTSLEDGSQQASERAEIKTNSKWHNEQDLPRDSISLSDNIIKNQSIFLWHHLPTRPSVEGRQSNIDTVQT